MAATAPPPNISKTWVDPGQMYVNGDGVIICHDDYLIGVCKATMWKVRLPIMRINLQALNPSFCDDLFELPIHNLEISTPVDYLVFSAIQLTALRAPQRLLSFLHTMVGSRRARVVHWDARVLFSIRICG